MKRLHLALGAALAGAAGLAYFGNRGGAPAAPPPRAPKAAPAMKTVGAVAILALRPRADLAGAAGEGDAGDRFDARDDLFISQRWGPPKASITAQSAPAQQAHARVSVPAAAPLAPALPFIYLGKALEAGAWDVFLERAGQVHVVRLDSLIDGQYRVAAIAPPVMRLTYLPLNQVLQLDIGGAD